MDKDFISYAIPSISPTTSKPNTSKYILGGVVALIAITVIVLVILYLTGVIGKQIEPKPEDEDKRR